MSDVPIPIFPLGLVLYPGQQLPLHIFEPRYKDLVRDSLEQDSMFGIVLFRDGVLADVGCTAEISRVLRTYDDGRMDLLVTGRRRFRVRGILHDRSYLQATVRLLSDDDEPSDLLLRERLITQHMKLLELGGRSPSPSLYEGTEHVSFLVANNAGLSIEQRQQVLEMPDETLRINYLVSYMEAFIPKVEEAEQMRKLIQSNGHFPDFPLDPDEPDDTDGATDADDTEENDR